MSDDNTELSNDYELEWIFARYENGDNVGDIARQLEKSESFVYSRMQQIPEKYEDVKKIREQKHNTRIRRVWGLADKIVLDYLEEIETDKDKAADAIDKVSRIAKEYAHRVRLQRAKIPKTLGLTARTDCRSR